MVELQSRRFVVTRVVVRIASVGLLAVSCTSAPSSTAAANAVVPAATALVTAEPTPAEATPTPTAAVTAIPVATATPDPTATPGPTATPAPAVEAECVRLTEFATDVDAALWRVVNDGVMGGLSQGVATFADSTMRFAGEINTNGGGFSSVRVGLLPGALDGANRIVVRARTDGRIYKLTFDDALAGRDQRISHQADLRFTAGDDWQIGVLSFDDLTASLFGRAVQTEPFRPDLVIEMGVILSDGIDGPFQIDLDWIDACK